MKKTIITIILLFILANANDGYCLLNWNWQVNNPTQNVLPSETAYLYASIFNESSSNEYLSKASVYQISMSWSTSPKSPSYYDVRLGIYGGLFGEPFDSMQLAPGESMDFTFGRFIPLSNMTPVGLQLFGTAGIMIDGISKESDMFSFTVVPEPISSTLFLIGGAVLGFRKLRKRVS